MTGDFLFRGLLPGGAAVLAYSRHWWRVLDPKLHKRRLLSLSLPNRTLSYLFRYSSPIIAAAKSFAASSMPRQCPLRHLRFVFLRFLSSGSSLIDRLLDMPRRSAPPSSPLPAAKRHKLSSPSVSFCSQCDAILSHHGISPSSIPVFEFFSHLLRGDCFRLQSVTCVALVSHFNHNVQHFLGKLYDFLVSSVLSFAFLREIAFVLGLPHHLLKEFTSPSDLRFFIDYFRDD